MRADRGAESVRFRPRLGTRDIRVARSGAVPRTAEERPVVEERAAEITADLVPVEGRISASGGVSSFWSRASRRGRTNAAPRNLLVPVGDGRHDAAAAAPYSAL